jgi:hypothetical protein
LNTEYRTAEVKEKKKTAFCFFNFYGWIFCGSAVGHSAEGGPCLPVGLVVCK